MTFNKRFYWGSSPPANLKGAKEAKRESVLVDVVAQGGLEWVKVSTITETRLLFDLAKAGWEAADSSSSDASSDDEDGVIVNSNSSKPTLVAGGHSPLSNHPIELVRLATDLRRASRANLLRYRYPSIRFVLPKIPTHPSPQTETILSEILATGATIECGPSNLPYPSLDQTPSPPSFPTPTSIFQNLLPDPHASLTPTLNIDCTILLALISDLSHSSRTPHSPTHHKAITRQITLEVSDPLLPDSLYPALARRDLVCTPEAAKRMLEIVHQIGTESERKRAWLLLGHQPHEPTDENIYYDNSNNNKPPTITSSTTLRTLLSAQSEYPIPTSLRLPIHVIPAGIQQQQQQQHLPAIAQKVAANLTAINQSVFLYGWAAGITTVSSNRTVAKVIEGIIGQANERRAENADDDDDNEIIQGPEIWLCSTARSLVGKEKGQRG